MKALIIGATGATGKDLLQKLIKDSYFTEIHVFVRRKLWRLMLKSFNIL
jgi:uncharacterized protein YbjT (DUF2867 family)